MNKKNLHVFLACLSLALLFCVVVIHLRFVALPVFFLALGLLSYLWSGKKALVLFFFLLPMINSTPDIFFNGYPFNYMGVSLFYLSGIMIASRLKKEKPEFAFPGYDLYLLFLSLISVSVFFMFLRWSNLTLSPLAFLRDTPVAPSGERLSFACIFPVITLALFSLTPFLAFLIRFWHFEENEIFTPLKAGFCFSFLLALVQKWLNPDIMAQSWWIVKNNQVNGGFSDFNAFGFFAGAMFLYQAMLLVDQLSWRKELAAHDPAAAPDVFPRSRGLKTLLPEIFFLMIALAAIFISGCRTAFLFVLVAVLRIILSRKMAFLAKAIVVMLLAVSLLVAGGTLKKRLRKTVVQTTRISTTADIFRAGNAVSNGRLAMLRDSARMVIRFLGSGVGAGNFLFYLKYLRFGENDYLDLPLNQYLLVFSETGLAGGLVFVFFLVVLLRRQKPGIMRFIILAIAIALLFNNFFWFPEVLLLFWLFSARAEWWTTTPVFKRPDAWGAAVLLIFVFMNIITFRVLHPKTWAHAAATPYDYGLYIMENENGRQFNWTGEKAGVYIYLDQQGRSADYDLVCGAPLKHLPNSKQTVDVYWRGRFLKSVVFSDNSLYPLQIEDQEHSEGFLEFRVRPTFNLKHLGLGTETRNLGIQLSGGSQ